MEKNGTDGSRCPQYLHFGLFSLGHWRLVLVSSARLLVQHFLADHCYHGYKPEPGHTDLEDVLPTVFGALIIILLFSHFQEDSLFIPYLTALSAGGAYRIGTDGQQSEPLSCSERRCWSRWTNSPLCFFCAPNFQCSPSASQSSSELRAFGSFARLRCSGDAYWPHCSPVPSLGASAEDFLIQRVSSHQSTNVRTDLRGVRPLPHKCVHSSFCMSHPFSFCALLQQAKNRCPLQNGLDQRPMT